MNRRNMCNALHNSEFLINTPLDRASGLVLCGNNGNRLQASMDTHTGFRRRLLGPQNGVHAKQL